MGGGLNRARKQQLRLWLVISRTCYPERKKKMKFKPSEIELEDPYSPNNYAENFNH